MIKLQNSLQLATKDHYKCLLKIKLQNIYGLFTFVPITTFQKSKNFQRLNKHRYIHTVGYHLLNGDGQ